MAVVAIRIAIDMNLFSALHKANRPERPEELLKRVGGDETLIRRVIRELATSGVIDEVSKDTFAENALSQELLTQEACGAMCFLTDVCIPFYAQVPASIEHRNFRCPSDPYECPWQDGMNTKLSFFEWLQTYPEHLNQFGGVMRGYSKSRPIWFEYFPSDNLFENDDKQALILVDVGGGLGHGMHRFLAKYPTAKGRLVLEDLPEVIDQVQPTNDITLLAHDFFQQQPICNARVYFLHSILHDWPSDKVKIILQNLVSAMQRGYSQILINESAIRTRKPTQMSTSVDMVKMSLFAGSERTEEEFDNFLKDVGLNLVKVLESPIGGQSLLEVNLL